MNIILFASCPSSVAYLEKLVALGERPLLCVSRTGCTAHATLAARCTDLVVPFDGCESIADPALMQRVRQRAPELLIVAGWGERLSQELLDVPTLGAVNFHPSLLPAYRGKEPLFWAILRGERSVGITAHHMTAEIDGGSILFQQKVGVHARATSASLARAVDERGARYLPRLIAEARKGSLPAGKPPDGPGSAFPALREEHGALDFTRSAVELDRLVRAAWGELRAYCFFRGMRLFVLEAEVERNRAARAGRIRKITEAGVEIGTAKGTLRVRKWVFVERVVDGRALARELGMKVGDAVGSNPAFG